MTSGIFRLKWPFKNDSFDDQNNDIHDFSLSRSNSVEISTLQSSSHNERNRFDLVDMKKDNNQFQNERKKKNDDDDQCGTDVNSISHQTSKKRVRQLKDISRVERDTMIDLKEAFENNLFSQNLTLSDQIDQAQNNLIDKLHFTDSTEGDIYDYLTPVSSYDDSDDDGSQSKLLKSNKITNEILFHKNHGTTFTEIEETQQLLLVERAKKRHMSTTQEVWNAVTMLIAPSICLFYVLSAQWMPDITSSPIDTTSNFTTTTDSSPIPTFTSAFYQALFSNKETCIPTTPFSRMHALPPLTTASVLIGMMLHAPVSIYYHLLCAFYLPSGADRIYHWSRRLDQALIHIMSAIWSYGSTGNFDYFMLSLAINVDSAYRLFQNVYRPKSILFRMLLSMLLPIIPMLINREISYFVYYCLFCALGSWLFITYPFKGWSHGWFHIAMSGAVPFLLSYSTMLPASQEQIEIAVQCARLASSSSI